MLTLRSSVPLKGDRHLYDQSVQFVEELVAILVRSGEQPPAPPLHPVVIQVVAILGCPGEQRPPTFFRASRWGCTRLRSSISLEGGRHVIFPDGTVAMR